MSNIRARNLFLLILAFLPALANPCSCNLKPLDEVYAASTDVFIAEVISIRRTTEQPTAGELADYVATFRLTHVFKGDPARRFDLEFQSRYEENDPWSPLEDITVGGCEHGFEIDEMYVFLRNGAEPLDVRWCSSRIHAPYRLDMEFLEKLANGD